MAGAVKTIPFATRHVGITECGIINLKFAEGDLRAEYLSGSEVHTDDHWDYQFLIQEEDLPSGLLMSEVVPGNIIDPYWECPEEEEAEEDECPARMIKCFDDIEDIDTLLDTDEVAILRFDEECGQWCLRRFPAESFLNNEDSNPHQTFIDYEVIPPGIDVQDEADIYVTHLPAAFQALAMRVSLAHVGSDTTINVKVKANGTDVFPTNAGVFATVGESSEQPMIPNTNFPSGIIPIGARITVTITGSGYVMYGDNSKGVRLAFRGIVPTLMP